MFARAQRRCSGAVCAAALVAAQPVRAAPGEGEPPAATAGAEDPQAEAQRLFDAGSEAYNLGKFDVAIERFEAAYGLSRATSLLYNLGQAYTKRYEVDPDPTHLRRAKVLFENFAKLSEAGGEDPRDARARAAAIAAQLEQLGAAEPVVEGPEPAPAVTTTEPPVTTTPPPPAPRRYRPGPLGISGYALAGAGLVAGTAMATLGFVSADRLASQRAGESELVPLPQARLALYEDRLGQARGLGFAGVGVGAGLLVVGVALIVADAVRGRGAGRRAALQPRAGGFAVAF